MIINCTEKWGKNIQTVGFNGTRRVSKRNYHLTGDTGSKARFIFNELRLKSKRNLSVDAQTWIRGKANREGYFTLQNKATGKYLTSETTSEVKLEGELIGPIADIHKISFTLYIFF